MYDFQLILYDAAVGGSQFGPIVTRDDVAVANGVFTTSLDFGAAFTGSQRWLDIGVLPGRARHACRRSLAAPGGNAGAQRVVRTERSERGKRGDNCRLDVYQRSSGEVERRRVDLWR